MLNSPLAPRLALVAIGSALLVLTGLGGPALRTIGDNGFMALALAAGVAAMVATRLTRELPDNAAHLALILAVGVALRLIVLGQPPLLSDDIYRYVWDGRVQAAGINPYRYVPADPVLAGLRDASIYPFINRADYAHTIYPPVAQAFFFVVTRVSETVLGMRIALVLCECVTIAAIIGLLRLIGRPSTRVIAYVWHPLPVWEIANNGHVDGLMVALTMAGLWVALVGGRKLPGAVAVTLGALAKPFALLALPPLWRPWDWRIVETVAAVIVVAYLPYLSVGRGVFGFLGSGYVGEQGLDSGAAFWLLRMARLLVGPTSGDVVAYLAASATVILGLSLRAGFRRSTDPSVVLGDVATLFAAFLILLSPEYPWYYVSLVPFLALFGSPTSWVLTALGFMLYDVVVGDPQIPFFMRAGAFNLTVIVALIYEWRSRRLGSKLGPIGHGPS